MASRLSARRNRSLRCCLLAHRLSITSNWWPTGPGTPGMVAAAVPPRRPPRTLAGARPSDVLRRRQVPLAVRATGAAVRTPTAPPTPRRPGRHPGHPGGGTGRRHPARDPDATRPSSASRRSRRPRPAAPPPAADRTRPAAPAAPSNSRRSSRPGNRPGSSCPPEPAAAGRSGARPAPRREPRSRARIVRRVLLALVLVWVLFLVVVPIWAWSQIEKVDASPDGDRPGRPARHHLPGRRLGQPRRPDRARSARTSSTGNAGGQRTDTIMLLHTR